MTRGSANLDSTKLAQDRLAEALVQRRRPCHRLSSCPSANCLRRNQGQHGVLSIRSTRVPETPFSRAAAADHPSQSAPAHIGQAGCLALMHLRQALRAQQRRPIAQVISAITQQVVYVATDAASGIHPARNRPGTQDPATRRQTPDAQRRIDAASPDAGKKKLRAMPSGSKINSSESPPRRSRPSALQ